MEKGSIVNSIIILFLVILAIFIIVTAIWRGSLIDLSNVPILGPIQNVIGSVFSPIRDFFSGLFLDEAISGYTQVHG